MLNSHLFDQLIGLIVGVTLTLIAMVLAIGASREAAGTRRTHH